MCIFSKLKKLSMFIVMIFTLNMLGQIVPKALDSTELSLQNADQNIVLPGNYVISGSNNIVENGTISVYGSGEYNIVLDNVSIDVSDTSRCAFFIENNPEIIVNITLKGENMLKSGSGKAGISVPEYAALTINGDGILYAKGGIADSSGAGGAGIGGDTGCKCGTVIVNSGKIYAKGEKYAAGIGGSKNTSCRVEINGGNIEAYGGEDAAGIGGGYGKSGGSITISAGTVYADGFYDLGAGLDYKGTKGIIEIMGGSVNTANNLIYPAEVNFKSKTAVLIPDCVNKQVENILIAEEEYNSSDVLTDNSGKLYLWCDQSMSVKTVSVCISGEEYSGVLKEGEILTSLGLSDEKDVNSEETETEVTTVTDIVSDEGTETGNTETEEITETVEESETEFETEETETEVTTVTDIVSDEGTETGNTETEEITETVGESETESETEETPAETETEVTTMTDIASDEETETGNTEMEEVTETVEESETEETTKLPAITTEPEKADKSLIIKKIIDAKEVLLGKKMYSRYASDVDVFDVVHYKREILYN